MYPLSNGSHDYNNRNANQFNLPPRPSSTILPPLPPLPSPQPHHNAIDAHPGNVGQYFGPYGPAPPQM